MVLLFLMCVAVSLQERLTVPSRLSGICPRPSFPGPQEFFSDFISVADSHIFNRHLSDAFLSKITEVGRNISGCRFYSCCASH